MEVFFNELSCQPFAADGEKAKSKITNMLGTLKLMRDDGFNVMRTSMNFYTLELAHGYLFANYFNDPNVSRDLKMLLKGVTKTPYIEDDSSKEAEVFVLSDFITKNEKGVDVSPEGLSTAYIFNSPSISLMGHTHWERDLIPLIIISDENHRIPVSENVQNVYSTVSVTSQPFKDWLKSLVDGIQLNTKANIGLVFSLDRFEFEERAAKELISWYYDDRRFMIRIRDLINDIINNPFKGGKGHTELLGGTGGKASKRIVGKDRIVYTYTEGKIIIHQCRGHYDDK